MTEQQAPQPAPPQETAPAKKRRWRMTRRGFLIGAGVTGAGVALGITFGLPVARLKIAETLEGAGGPPGSFPADPSAWFELLPDGRIRLFLTKVEMGQGVHTALAQIGVEELGVEWSDLEIVQAGTHQGPEDGFGTGGSNSVASVYAPLRQAAATLQQMLRNQAARLLDVAPAELALRERALVVEAEPSRRVTLAELATGNFVWEVPEEGAPLKQDEEFRFIGQSIPRNDIPAKVTGQAIYGYDKQVEGMLYGAVARPPTIEGSMAAAWPISAREVPGVVEIVTDESTNFAGVVATSRDAARAGLDAMRIQWRAGKPWQQEEIEALVTVGERGGVTIQNEGDAPAQLENGLSLTAEYRSPLAVQTPLEPQAALAHVQPGRVQVWASTQSQNGLRSAIAQALDVPAATVEVTPTYLGGGFGRKLAIEAAIEAARLSQATGAPVHVGWDRTEALRYGYFRPPTHHKLYAAVDDRGHITALEHRQASGDVAFPFFPPVAAMIMGADFGAYRGATIRYAIPNRRTVAWRSKLPVRTGWWRGLGLLANTFAVESFMDELAHMTGADPLQYRLDHLGDDPWGRRMAAVLEAAADLADWGAPVEPGRARGLACCTDVDTVVAQVAEVSVDPESGRLRIHKVSAAMDCGKTINPDGAKAQVEGAIMWGVGSALTEEVRIQDGAVALTNFDSYPILSMREAPDVAVTLLEAGDGRPRGVGEPPIGPVAAAIGNALYALTGHRQRRLPMAPAVQELALSQSRPGA